MSTCKDRRQHPRVRIKFPVVGRTGDFFLEGEIRDLSLGGAYIRCSTTPEVEDAFHLVISAGGRLMLINVEMIWLDVCTLSSHPTMRGMGVRFKQIFNGDRRFLQDEITRRHRSRFRLSPKIGTLWDYCLSVD